MVYPRTLSAVYRPAGPDPTTQKYFSPAPALVLYHLESVARGKGRSWRLIRDPRAMLGRLQAAMHRARMYAQAQSAAFPAPIPLSDMLNREKQVNTARLMYTSHSLSSMQAYRASPLRLGIGHGVEKMSPGPDSPFPCRWRRSALARSRAPGPPFIGRPSRPCTRLIFIL